MVRYGLIAVIMKPVFYLAQSLLLNVDLVTMFDPMTTQQLKQIEQKCKECSERMDSQQQDI